MSVIKIETVFITTEVILLLHAFIVKAYVKKIFVLKIDLLLKILIGLKKNYILDEITVINHIYINDCICLLKFY